MTLIRVSVTRGVTCTMAPSACSHLPLSSGFEMCGIAIEDDKKTSGEMKVDREVMDVLKLVLDGEFASQNILPELLKMNKGKLVIDILMWTSTPTIHPHLHIIRFLVRLLRLMHAN
jgi:hypothetical protein